MTRLRLLAGALVAFAVALVHAADAPAQAPAAPAEDATPETITTWTQDALQQLFALRPRVTITPEAGKQIADLALLRRRYQDNYEPLRKDPSRLDKLTETALQDTRADLDAIAAEADAADERLTAAATQLEARLHEITALRDRAKKLKAAPSDTPLPAALRGRLDAVINEAAPVQRAAEQSLERLSRAQTGVLELKEDVSVLKNLAAETSARRVRELFRFEEPRLWSVTPNNVAASARHSGALVSSSAPAALRKFAAEHAGALVFQGVVFVVMLIALFRLSRSQEMRDEQERSKALTRPVSAAVLIALILTPVLHPTAPFVVRELAVAVLIVPMLRILTLYFDRSAWPQLFGLVAIAFIDRVVSALAIEVLVQRLTLLALSIAMTVILVWARRTQLEKSFGLGEPAQRWTRVLFTTGLIASVIGILLNLFGNVGLAYVVQSTAVRAMMVAAALRAMVVVVREMGRLVTRSMERRGWRAVARHRATMMRRLDIVTVTFGAGIWVYYTLAMLRLNEIVIGGIASVLAAEAKLGEVTLSLSRVLAFVVAVWIAVRVSGITRALLNDDVLPRFPLPRGVPNAISVIANYTIVLIGLLIGAGILGISFSNLTLIMGALGVGIGFGLQNIVNNFVSGLILVFERPVQVGDDVQIDQVAGVVTHIGFRASRIRTYSGSEVIVPNGDLISRQFVNWTLSDRRRRVELLVTVAYGNDGELVERTLLEIAKADKEVMVEPPPTVIMDVLGPAFIEVRLYCWVADLDIAGRVKNRLNQAIAQALIQKHIHMPAPALPQVLASPSRG